MKLNMLFTLVFILLNASPAKGGLAVEHLGIFQQEYAMKTITISSTAFVNGQAVPKKYSGEGQDVSPPLSWTGVPGETQQLTLIVDDPDAPIAEPWVHWVLYGLSPATTGLPEEIPAGSEIKSPVKAFQGKTSKGNFGYHGPMPPKGHGVHHYHFKIYALDAPLSLGAGVDKKKLLQAMSGHIIAQGELVGTYQR
jgi:Raf kinase inhibitor-like YbhB/YbcL family protein